MKFIHAHQIRLSLIIAVLALSNAISAVAQKDTILILPDRGYENPVLKLRHKEVGLNMTYLLGQFVPLASSTLYPGVIDYSFKAYGTSGTAFRFGFGAKLPPLLIDDEIIPYSHFGLRVGFERRKHLYKRFYYTIGLDGILYLGTLDGALTNPGSFGGGIGLGTIIGIEYHLNDYMYLSTESMLFVGLLDIVRIVPPSAIFLNYLIPNKTVKK